MEEDDLYGVCNASNSYGHTYAKVYRRPWYAPWRKIVKWSCGHCWRVVRDVGGYPGV